MTDPWEDDDWQEMSDGSAPAEDEGLAFMNQGNAWNPHQISTTKIPPSFNGQTSWFAYEDAIDEWCDITELDDVKRAPAHRNRLEGDAAIYKAYLDRDQLTNHQEGVKYFKKTIRQYFVKGVQHVFLWRFMQLFKFHRGQQDMHKWLGKIGVLHRRAYEAWMDTLTELDDEQILVMPGFIEFNQQQQRAQPVALDQEQELANLIARYRDARREDHRVKFPLSNNLLALVMIVQADLSEMQRERFTSTMVLRNFSIGQYRIEDVRTVFQEFFCAPKKSLENPSLRTMTPQTRSFCIIEDGEMDGLSGYWVEDDVSGEQGFLPELDNAFMTFDDQSEN